VVEDTGGGAAAVEDTGGEGIPTEGNTRWEGTVVEDTEGEGVVGKYTGGEGAVVEDTGGEGIPMEGNTGGEGAVVEETAGEAEEEDTGGDTSAEKRSWGKSCVCANSATKALA